MANIMNLKDIRNNPSRGGFDLSRKVYFTAKAGELLPVAVIPTVPNDSFEFVINAFSRTRPVNTAAYCGMTEYYDAFFVPMSQLWSHWNTVVTRMQDNPQHAVDLLGSYDLKSGDLPYFTTRDLWTYLDTMQRGYTSGSAIDPSNKNFFGFDRAVCSSKLLQYLGYGDFIPDQSGSGSSLLFEFIDDSIEDLKLNPFPLLAYQKIYSSYFRFSQWERSNPSSFNVDYLNSDDHLHIDLSKLTANLQSFSTWNMLDLRYSNFARDRFFGSLPRAQYGDEAVAPVTGSEGSEGVSALAIRLAEYSQKAKEIIQSGDEDYKDQIERVFGMPVSELLSGVPRHLFSVTNRISVSEVENTNLADDNASILRGKGVGSSSSGGSYESSGEYGYIIVMYHCRPDMVYSTSGVSRECTRTNVSDFGSPLFDKIGMESTPTYLLINNKKAWPAFEKPSNWPEQLGYVPRYTDYKTSYDRAIGGFKESLRAWITAFDDEMMVTQLGYVPFDTEVNSNTLNQSGVMYPFFKLNPHVLDNIFDGDVDSSLDSDQFWCSADIQISAVRPFDENGLPY